MQRFVPVFGVVQIFVTGSMHKFDKEGAVEHTAVVLILQISPVFKAGIVVQVPSLAAEHSLVEVT
jgi:hypothetical protein